MFIKIKHSHRKLTVFWSTKSFCSPTSHWSWPNQVDNNLPPYLTQPRWPSQPQDKQIFNTGELFPFFQSIKIGKSLAIHRWPKELMHSVSRMQALCCLLATKTRLIIWFGASVLLKLFINTDHYFIRAVFGSCLELPYLNAWNPENVMHVQCMSSLRNAEKHRKGNIFRRF